MTTAKKYFDEDIKRALLLLMHAKVLETNEDESQMPKDIRGASVALAVAAMDKYFSDKYVDCLTASLISYAQGKWSGSFPSSYSKAALPAGEVLDASRTKRPKWGIRMAVRSIMERDFMYALSRLADAFNGILPNGQKLWEGITNPLAALNRKRFTTHTSSDLAALAALPDQKRMQEAEKKVRATVKSRIGATVQFRHDLIHNCSRPKEAIVNYNHHEAHAAIREIESLVNIIETHLETYRLA